MFFVVSFLFAGLWTIPDCVQGLLLTQGLLQLELEDHIGCWRSNEGQLYKANKLYKDKASALSAVVSLAPATSVLFLFLNLRQTTFR